MPSRSSDEATVRSWGFNHVFTWTDGPNAHYPPHSHSGLTTHLVRRGELTITYPKDETPTKETFGVGGRIDVPAGKVHEVWMGKDGTYYTETREEKHWVDEKLGCEYVIGE